MVELIIWIAGSVVLVVLLTLIIAGIIADIINLDDNRFCPKCKRKIKKIRKRDREKYEKEHNLWVSDIE